MEKVESLREVSIWADLNRDILGLIFNKLDVMDITIGASRVCISWFLASHKKSLWNTVDLAKLQELDISHRFDFKKKVPRPIFLYKYPVDPVNDKGLMNHLVKIMSSFLGFLEEEEGGISLMNLLIEITKLSRKAPKNLFFNFNSIIQENGLKFAAERMPQIEKLALPVWCYQTENSFRFAFSHWKNLKTLIIAHEYCYTGRFEFQAVGESCSNLTNLKYLGNVYEYNARKIVLHLQSLQRLSLRCSSIKVTLALLLINGLQKLKILNLSHCKNLNLYPITISTRNFVQAANQKLENFIICSQGCRICKDRCRNSWSFLCEEYWRNDEIKELEF